MGNFIALQARKVPIPKEVLQEPQPMLTTPAKKSEATSKGHDAAQTKAEVPQTQLAALPPKIESQLTSRYVIYANSYTSCVKLKEMSYNLPQMNILVVIQLCICKSKMIELHFSPLNILL